MNLLRGGKTDSSCRLLVEILKMLSSKVIIAAEVLLSLEAEPDARGLRDFRYPRGTDLTPLCEACRERKPLLRVVLRRLMEGGYIRCTNGKNSYALLKNPAEISLLSLVILFHGDLCIGELYAHRLTTGREDFRTPSSRRLRQWESEQYEQLRHVFAHTPVTFFRDAQTDAPTVGPTGGLSDAPTEGLVACASPPEAPAAGMPVVEAPAVGISASEASYASMQSPDRPADAACARVAPAAAHTAVAHTAAVHTSAGSTAEMPSAAAQFSAASFSEPAAVAPGAEAPLSVAPSAGAPAADVPFPVPVSCIEG